MKRILREPQPTEHSFRISWARVRVDGLTGWPVCFATPRRKQKQATTRERRIRENSAASFHKVRDIHLRRNKVRAAGTYRCELPSLMPRLAITVHYRCTYRSYVLVTETARGNVEATRVAVADAASFLESLEPLYGAFSSLSFSFYYPLVTDRLIMSPGTSHNPHKLAQRYTEAKLCTARAARRSAVSCTWLACNFSCRTDRIARNRLRNRLRRGCIRAIRRARQRGGVYFVDIN